MPDEQLQPAAGCDRRNDRKARREGVSRFGVHEDDALRPGPRQAAPAKDLELDAWEIIQLAKAQQQEQEPQYFKGRDAEDYVLAQW